MRQSYQVHRQRFSQKFSWLVSFWSLALSSLSKVVKTLWSFRQAKSHLISLLCYGTQLFEIEILISSVFAYHDVFRWCLQNLSKSWMFFIHQKWINLNTRLRVKTNIMHRIVSNNLYRSRVYLWSYSFSRCVFNKRIKSDSNFYVLLILTTQIFYKVKMRR